MIKFHGKNKTKWCLIRRLELTELIDYGSPEIIPARLHPLQDREGVDIKTKETSSELSSTRNRGQKCLRN